MPGIGFHIDFLSNNLMKQAKKWCDKIFENNTLLGCND